MRAAGRELAERGGIPRVAPCALSCVWGRRGGEGAPRPARPAWGAACRHPPTPRRGSTLGGGAERQLSCSHFLIVVFEAPGSRAERFAVPAPRFLEGGAASDGGGATPRRGGEGALGGGAAGPAEARECGAPAPRAAGPGDARASPPAGRGGWRARPPSPDLTAARRHGASPPDGPVSIPGGEGVGAARRPPGARGWRGSGAGSRTRWVRGGPEDAGARGQAETSPCPAVRRGGGWGGR